MNNNDLARYGNNSHFNFYTPSRSVAIPPSGIPNDRNYVPHPSNTDKITQQTKHIFAVDSRQRDFVKYSDANEYEILVPEYYKNIKSVELKAALIPKTEYNIHSCNNNVPFSLGDFISEVRVNSGKNFFSGGTRPIDGETITFTVTSSPAATVPARLSATTLNGGIGPITIDYGGSGYTPDSNITINANLTGYDSIIDFDITVGLEYVATLREGHYSNTGNPKYFHVVQSGGVRTPMRSHVPVHGLSRELENAIADAIYSKNEINTSYSYGRVGWYELYYDPVVANYDVGGASESLDDKPAPISVRYVSQYPTLDRFTSRDLTTEQTSNYYATNSCDFNRIDFTNQLVIKLQTTDAAPANVGGIFEYDDYYYEVVDYHLIGEVVASGGDYEYLMMLYPVGTYAGAVRTPGIEVRDTTVWWSGITSSLTLGTLGVNYFLDPANIDNTTIAPSPWHLLFQKENADICSLLGFRRINYNNGTTTENVLINTTSGADHPLLYAGGQTHRTYGDWTLYPGPEYVILSFRSNLTNTSSTYNSDMNDRVDSDQESNLGRSFAALILDNNQPAVLQGLTTSRGAEYDLSGFQDGETTDKYTQILNLSDEYKTSISGTDIKTDSRILDSYVGNTDSGLYIPPGITKALKGSDFDVKKIEFKTPVSRLNSLSIQFTKFNKINSHTTKELYDFKGRENLLLFEIITEENINIY